jgi:hypothetical protein
VEEAVTATLWNVAAYGWTCQGETRSGLTTVSTWTRDERVLVLVFLGECEVQAAVLDGEPVDPEKLQRLVAGDENPDPFDVLFDRARAHAEHGDPNRMGTELAALFESARKLTVPRCGSVQEPVIPMRLRGTLYNLALAVLSTPRS